METNMLVYQEINFSSFKSPYDVSTRRGPVYCRFTRRRFQLRLGL